MPSKSKRKSRMKISSGTKDNINTIITEISIITGRKSWPKDDSIQALTDAFANTDAHIAALGLVVPEIDAQWRTSGARDAFLRIKKKRQFLTRFLISLFVIFSLMLLAGAIVSIFFWTHWARFIIVLVAVFVLFFGSTYISKFIMGPFINKRDANIPTKYQRECVVINDFITELIKLGRK